MVITILPLCMHILFTLLVGEKLCHVISENAVAVFRDG